MELFLKLLHNFGIIDNSPDFKSTYLKHVIGGRKNRHILKGLYNCQYEKKQSLLSSTNTLTICYMAIYSNRLFGILRLNGIAFLHKWNFSNFYSSSPIFTNERENVESVVMDYLIIFH